MGLSLLIILAAFLSSLALSFLGTRTMIQLAPKMGWFEEVKKDRWHSRPTAKLGGIAIYISLMAVTTVYFWPLSDMKVVGLLIGTTMIFVLGLTDDLRSVSPGVKVLVQTAAAVVAVVFGVHSEYFSPFIGFPLTVLWIIAVTNAYNLIDNMDGLSAGIAVVSSLTLFILSAIMGWAEAALLSAVMFGAALGFLRYNFNPARIFMGDCGALTIGFYISVVALIGSMTYMSDLIITLVAPILVMAVPILDTTFVTVLRAVSGRPVYQGGMDHSSHRLVLMGLSEKQSVLVIYFFSLVFGGFAVLLAVPGVSYLFVWTLLILCLIFLFLLGLFLSEPDLKEIEERARSDGGRVRIKAILLNKKYIVVEIISDILIIAASYILAYYLMGNGLIGRTERLLIERSLPIFVFIQMASFYLFGVYRGVWKYVSLGDLMRIVQGALVGTAVSSLILFFVTFFIGYSASVVIVYFFIMTFFVTARAGSLRSFSEFFTRRRARRAPKKVIVFGAGDSGNAVLKEILNNHELGLKPLGFIDDDPAKSRMVINGLKVLGTRRDLGRVIREEGADEVIVAVSDLADETLGYIEHVCKKMGIAVIRVPGILNVDR